MADPDLIRNSITFCSLVTAAISLYKLYQSTHIETPKRKNGVEELIGNTPMVKIKSLSSFTNCEIYAKLELCNPAGSAKDRVALNIIKTAEEEGRLTRNDPNKVGWVFEGTSGSTGISIAMICNALGYKSHISLPDDTSLEKIALLKSLGAHINLVKPASIVDPDQYVNAAKKACQELNASGKDQGIFADQFENEANWKIHFATTGPEIYRQMNGDIDAFIAGCGTGGTITGVSKYLKSQNSNIYTVLADPQGSGFYNRINFGVMYDNVEKEGSRRRHQVDTIVEGIGLNRITKNFHHGESFIDESIKVTDKQAIGMAKFLSINDGLFIGSSTAINAIAAVKLGQRSPPGTKIVIIACDSGSRHLSKFWKEAQLVDNNVTLNELIES